MHSETSLPVALVGFDAVHGAQIFASDDLAELQRLVRLVHVDLGHPDAVAKLAGQGIAPADVRVLVTGWPTPRVSTPMIDLLPNLGLIAHAGGTVKSLLPEQGLPETITVSSCTTQNAIPVAEFTLAAILFSNKQVLQLAERYRQTRQGRDAVLAGHGELGNYRRTIGLVGASTIGRLVARLLQPFDLDVLIADPYLDDEEAATLGVSKMSLEAIFARSDVVSLHAPLLPETHGMIGARHFSLMKPGATLINTARGALIDQDALIAALQVLPIYAVIDTTWPEVPDGDSPLWTLPNVLLTPHIAGSGSTELHRHGNNVLAAISAFLDERPIPGRVAIQQLDRIA